MKKRVFAIIITSLFAMSSISCGIDKNKTQNNSDNEIGEDSHESSEDNSNTDSGSFESALSDVTYYPNEDERILFGTYELEDRYLSRFSDKTDAEKEELFNKYQSGLHFTETEVEIIPSLFDTKSLSVEPVAIEFGYAAAGGSIINISYPFLEQPIGDSEESNYIGYTVNHQSELVLKAADKLLYENMDGEEAVQISQNLRQLCDCSLMTMTFAEENSTDSVRYQYIYKIDNDRILYTPYTVNYLTLEMDVPPESEWNEMNFGFRGTTLVVEKDGQEIELESDSQVYRNASADGYFYLNGYADDELFQDIQDILISFNNGETHAEGFVTFADGSYASNVTADLDGKNHVTIQWTDSERASDQSSMAAKAGSVSFEFIAASNDGFAIYDGEKVYYYYSEDESYYSNIVADNLEEGTDITDLDEEEKSTLEDNRTVVVSALREGFSIAGINADVDEVTGKVMMDNSFLFAVDSDELSAEGLEYLDKFMDVYADVVKKQSEDGKIGCVKVVGHTDISGSYEYNLDLSERRAAAVVSYCTENYHELSGLITSEGKSYSEPIYNEDGSVNMDASRRVEFKAILMY